MTCPHEYTAVKYDCDGLPDPLELEFLECLDCGEWLSLGVAEPGLIREIRLAADIADLCILWEPGKEREQRIAKAVERWAVKAATHKDSTKGEP